MGIPMESDTFSENPKKSRDGPKKSSRRLETGFSGFWGFCGTFRGPKTAKNGVFRGSGGPRKYPFRGAGTPFEFYD